MTAYFEQELTGLSGEALKLALADIINGTSPNMLMGGISIVNGQPRLRANDYQRPLPDMSGADALNPGEGGLVVRPLAGDEVKYLRGDALWASPYDMPIPNDPPGAPDAANLRLYADKRMRQLGTVDEFGGESVLMENPAYSRIGMVIPTTGATTLTSIGCTTTTAGTATIRTLATTRFFTRKSRVGLVSAGTAGAIAEVRCGSPLFSMGNGANPYQGGFKVSMIFGTSDAAAVAGARQFYGVRPIGAATNVSPAALTNCIAVGSDASDTTLRIYIGGTAAQPPINLGADFPANTLSTDLYRLSLYNPHNTDMRVYVSLERLNTGSRVDYELIATTAGVQLPSWNQFLTYDLWRTNNAAALPVGFDFGGLVFSTPWGF